MTKPHPKSWQARHTLPLAIKRLARLSVVCAGAFLLCPNAPAANGTTSGDLSPFVGRWQIDLSQTHMKRMGPNGTNLVRSPTFTFLFSPEGKNLKLAVYAEYPSPTSPRVATIIPDRRPHACESKGGCLTVGGDPTQQTFEYFEINSHMLLRVFFVAGTAEEYTSYDVSEDGAIFTMIAWSPATPEYQNIQVFQKQP